MATKLSSRFLLRCALAPLRLQTPHLRRPPPPFRQPFRCFSSASPNQELPIECRDDQNHQQYQDHRIIEAEQEKQTRLIPVRAYFVCTSVNLRSLQAQNAFNVIPPASRAANYVVLRYYDGKGGEPFVSEERADKESSYHYMVVFHYGSIVLFNVSSDHEADGYLKIVEKHASGLLPEMRKDGPAKELKS